MSQIPDQCIPQIQENTKISNYPIKITFLGLELSEGVGEDVHVLTALSRNPLSNPGSVLGLSHLFHMPEVGGHQYHKSDFQHHLSQPLPGGLAFYLGMCY